jgi:GTPase SAR1 family protein
LDAPKVKRNCTQDIKAEECQAIGLSEQLANSSFGKFLEQYQQLGDVKAMGELPRIVVIGGESSGKSSLLERIAGQPIFPRDREICTRCPIKLSLRPCGQNQQMTSIRFRGHLQEVQPHQDLLKIVSSMMKTEVKLANSSLHGIVRDEMVIEMRKPGVSSLDLIDLPGIVAASIEGEPSDMMQQTRRLTEDYISNPNTVIVCVMPATIKRVRDSQAMQIVQQHGALGRSFGVLTMADMVHDPIESDPRWELRARLNGSSTDLVKLALPYVAVVNRDTRRNLLFEDSLTFEKKWFRSNLPEFDQKHQVGIRALIAQLDKHYTAYIREKWVPRAVLALRNKISQVDRELLALGSAPSRSSMVAIANEIKASASSIQYKILDTVKSSVVAKLKDLFDAKSITGNDLVDRIHRTKVVRQEMARQLSKPVLFSIGKSAITALEQHIKRCTALPNRLCRFEELPVAIWRHATNDAEQANSSTTADALERLERAVDALGSSYVQSKLSFSQWKEGIETLLHHTIIECVLLPLMAFLHDAKFSGDSWQSSGSFRENCISERAEFARSKSGFEKSIDILGTIGV